MASIYSWESFIRVHGGESGARDVFEKAMDELLRAENPGKEVLVVKAAPGDGALMYMSIMKTALISISASSLWDR